MAGVDTRVLIFGGKLINDDQYGSSHLVLQSFVMHVLFPRPGTENVNVVYLFLLQ
jgi:hypothetical protein